MGHITIFAVAALGFMPVALAIAINIKPPICDHTNTTHPVYQQSCAAEALSYLAGNHNYPVSCECMEEVSLQAADFCSSYLDVTATDVSTAISTATATLTLTATVTATSTSTTATTKIERSTEVIPSTSTVTIATSFVAPPPPTCPTSPARRRDVVSVCPEVRSKVILKNSPSQISSACGCLDITASTTTATQTVTTSTTASRSATASTTTAATVTTTLVLVLTSATTITTPTIKTATSLVAAIATVNYCDITYDGGGVPRGDTVIRSPWNLDGRQCCALCWVTPNCVAAATGLGYCQLLMKTSKLKGAPTNAMCPLGVENYGYQPGPGTLYRGPCSPGLNG